MDTKPETGGPCSLLRMASDIVAAHIGNRSTEPQDITSLISTVHSKLMDLNRVGLASKTTAPPAVPISESIHADYLICLEDGRKMKMLKRHLNTVFGLSPDQYRSKWGLPLDYPMVAPNYTIKRQELAKKIGLGKRRTA